MCVDGRTARDPDVLILRPNRPIDDEYVDPTLYINPLLQADPTVHKRSQAGVSAPPRLVASQRPTGQSS